MRGREDFVIPSLGEIDCKEQVPCKSGIHTQNGTQRHPTSEFGSTHHARVYARVICSNYYNPPCIIYIMLHLYV